MSDSLDYGPAAGADKGSWLSRLQPASWRGLPFGVENSEYGRGRRFAVHEYPKRDVPWPEDMGRATRTTAFSGFVVGDDCYEQAQALLDAAETYGAGMLVHPSLGQFWAAMVSPLVAAERKERGRVVELRFEVIEAGQPLYPDDADSTQDQVSDWSDNTQTASSSNFVASVGEHSSGNPDAAQTAGGPSPNDAGGTALTYTDSKGTTTTVPPAATSTPVYQDNISSQVRSSWGDMASQQAADPSLTAGAASSVQPDPGTTFGRFDGIGSLSFSTGTPEDAIEDQVQQRNEVDDAAEKAARAELIS